MEKGVVMKFVKWERVNTAMNILPISPSKRRYKSKEERNEIK
jgi:hypothetical protein